MAFFLGYRVLNEPPNSAILSGMIAFFPAFNLDHGVCARAHAVRRFSKLDSGATGS